MGKQTKSKTTTTQSFGKGKVTPMQIAFIVDRYLSDNSFSEARSVFRTEASSLISKSPVQEAPKSLLSLEAMLNEYICLKEQKVMVDQERVRLDQEKFRVQTLLQGMQDVMNAYNTSGAAPSPMILASSSTRPAPMLCGSAAGCPAYTSPTVLPISMPSNIIKDNGNLSSTVSNCPITRKRAASNVVAAEAPPATKKSRGKLPHRRIPIDGAYNQSNNTASTQGTTQTDNATSTNQTSQFSAIGSSPHNRTSCAPLVQGSSVAKSLFNQPWLSSPANSTGPNTPPQAVPSHNDKALSPVGISSNAHCRNNNTPQEIPTNCTVITSERVIVSPYKHVAYTMERNHCISSSSPVKTTIKRLSKRENVKGRLDFDGSDVGPSLDKPIVDEISTSESDKEVDIFDIDLPNLDAFGANFSFSELLVDLDLGYEGLGCPCPPILGSSADTVSGSSQESKDGNQGPDQVTSEFSSTVTEVISRDVNIQGPETITAVKSITKCIILSPAKSHRSCLQPETELSSK